MILFVFQMYNLFLLLFLLWFHVYNLFPLFVLYVFWSFVYLGMQWKKLFRLDEFVLNITSKFYI